jgi:hypothetical protein
MPNLQELLGKLPEYQKKAEQTDANIQKTLLIAAQNQIILKRIAEKLGVDIKDVLK